LVTSPVESLSLDDWERSFAVNARGHFLVCREALRVMREQGLGGALVLNVTKNVLAPGAEMAAYSSAKAAAMQLARVLAIEGGPLGVRVNVVHPDQVFTDLWTAEARESRARAHGVPVEKLEEFYAGRTLLRVGVTVEDVAEAVAFLASSRSAKTTGGMLVVDGGAKGSFPR
jgi:NAD(P)-dependent dehydrogenase (short-subunit alcohol dehydrogenase family)